MPRQLTCMQIVDSSHRCVLTWIRHPSVTSHAYLSLILDGLKNEHPMVLAHPNVAINMIHSLVAQLRAKCAEFVAEILEKDNAAHALRDEGDRFEAAVQRALADGDGDVRVMARRSYMTITQLWPERAQRCARTNSSDEVALTDVLSECGPSWSTQRSGSSTRSVRARARRGTPRASAQPQRPLLSHQR